MSYGGGGNHVKPINKSKSTITFEFLREIESDSADAAQRRLFVLYNLA